MPDYNLPKSVKAGKVKAQLPTDEEMKKIVEKGTAKMDIQGYETLDGKPDLTVKPDPNPDVKQNIVGWGTRADDLTPNSTITEIEAQARMDKQMEKDEALIKKYIDPKVWEILPDNIKGLLRSGTYNSGWKLFRKKDGTPTEFLKAIESGNFEKAASEWDFGSSNTKLPGLKKRRLSELKKAGLLKDPEIEMEDAVPPAYITGGN
jgi:GH24 family phage-related lysozyme (muramidase)